MIFDIFFYSLIGVGALMLLVLLWQDVYGQKRRREEDAREREKQEDEIRLLGLMAWAKKSLGIK